MKCFQAGFPSQASEHKSGRFQFNRIAGRLVAQAVMPQNPDFLLPGKDF
jgi:hypothetical protein